MEQAVVESAVETSVVENQQAPIVELPLPMLEKVGGGIAAFTI
jgi:hypothetical protein